MTNVATPTWDALAADLTHFTGSFPQSSLEAALQHPEVSAPALLAELEGMAADPAKRCDDQAGWMLHLYAMHLLAAQRDTRAFPLLMRIARLDETALEDSLGDHLTEGMPRALAATCPPNGEAELKALASDTAAYFWSRSAALRALSLRTLEGDFPREDLLAWLIDESEREADRMIDKNIEPDDSLEADYLSELMVTLEEIGAQEMTESVSDWFEDGLINEVFSKREQAMERLQRGWEACRADELAHGWGYPRDIIAEIGRWACFHPDEDDEDLDVEDNAPPQTPFTRDQPKVGRNDPCPCGSGKKYKKCCGVNV